MEDRQARSSFCREVKGLQQMQTMNFCMCGPPAIAVHSDTQKGVVCICVLFFLAVSPRNRPACQPQFRCYVTAFPVLVVSVCTRVYVWGYRTNKITNTCVSPPLLGISTRNLVHYVRIHEHSIV
jgi:hypothetical protein